MAAKTRHPDLSLVADAVYQLGRKPETTAQRVQRLQAEARMLAHEQVEAFQGAMKTLALQADEIAEGGGAYPVGIRELARQLSEDLAARSANCQSLLARSE